MKNLILWMLVLSLWAPLTGAALAADAPDERPQAPSFSLTSLDGKIFTEKEMLGKATLVIFWASWCGTCQHELPKVRSLQEKFKESPFQVIAIGFSDTKSNITRYVKKHADIFSFPVFYDEGDQVSGRFGARATPTLFLFDQEGKLVVPYRGGGLLEHPQFHKILAGLF